MMSLAVAKRIQRAAQESPSPTLQQRKSYKYAVKCAGDFVLDYSEVMRGKGQPCWFIGRGRVAGNTSPIPSGLHATPREAWKAAAIALGVAA